MAKRPKAKPVGRPSTFTQETADAICNRLAKGEPLAAICRDETMPGVTTVWEWKKARETFSDAIACAREIGFDQIAMDCLDIADETSNDTKKGPGDTDQCNSEWISRSRLRVETRLKLLAKWDPKRYGDKLDIAHEGGITVELVNFAPHSDS